MSRKWWKNLVKGENNQTTEGSEVKAPAAPRGRHSRADRTRHSEPKSDVANSDTDISDDSQLSVAAAPEQMSLIPRSSGKVLDSNLQGDITSGPLNTGESAPDLPVVLSAKNIYIPDDESVDERAERRRERAQDSGARNIELTAEQGDSDSDEGEDEELENSTEDLQPGAALVEDSYDDFETVYDLDRGSPFRGSDTGEESNRLPWKSYVESAKEFFNAEILYRFDILTQAEKEELSGTYRIELRGYKGGIWTLRLAAELEVSNRREEADVVLSMRQSHFLQIVNGEMNPQLAILAKKVRIIGNVRRALSFQNLLAPVRD